MGKIKLKGEAMELFAQRDNFVLVKTRDIGIFDFGFVIDFIKMKVRSVEINFASLLKGGDWEDPNFSKYEEREILSLVKKHLNLKEK